MADPQGGVPVHARTLDFYKVDASVIPDAARQLLVKYAGIPPEKVNDHVDVVRKKAFEIFPYPCIGMYRFLDLGLGQTGVYDDIVQRLKKGDKFLDLGCCFGQEIRQLISDGVPAENCYGSDLRQEFIDLGYDRVQDRDKEGRRSTS
jgi:2-polyprenyl-3-methyl-5-hydroxy-6-metoxy-1,4-benzoquinol methylase